MIYQGKVVAKHPRNGYVVVAVPQVSGAASQTARISDGALPNPGDNVWVCYESGNLTRPVVIPKALDKEMAELGARLTALEDRVSVLGQTQAP